MSLDALTRRLYEKADAAVWAREFMELFGDRPEIIDEGLMIGWFANAMEIAKRDALAGLEEAP